MTDATTLFYTGDAVVSDCGTYRYRLSRRWSDGPTAGFIMLNPSTADAGKDDPTIRRCVRFAMREGCGALMVSNLYAFRATNPDDLMSQAHPMGPDWRDNFDAFLGAVDGPLIAAWGAHKAADGMAATVRELLRHSAHGAQCLGKTASGQPRHPLYVKGDAPLVPL